MSALESFIITKRETQPILLMAHVIYGYPNIEQSLKMMETLLQKGVDILEVQFPFSDPVADGPVITDACHIALENNPRLGQCLNDVNQLAERYSNTKVLLMSYLNPLLQYGFKCLATDMAPNIIGLITPDLPIDQHALIAPLTDKNNSVAIDPIWLIIPNMQNERIDLVASKAQGMLYCVSRAGVTGQTDQSEQSKLQEYLSVIREHTKVPLALGFGISGAQDIKSIVGLADVAVVGSALLRAYQSEGMQGFSEKADQLLAACHDL
jgi:tryptophan synthase alpha chain